MLLQLERTAKHVDEPTRSELVEAQDTARGGLDDVRRIALELRPEALDELGLASALAALCDRFDRAGPGFASSVTSRSDLPPLPDESELVRLPGGAGGADQRRAPRRYATDAELRARSRRRTG